MINRPLRLMTMREDGTLYTALKKIQSNAKGIVFITNGDGKMTGLLTDGDIRRRLLKKANLRDRVSDHMNRKFTYVPENTPVEKMYQVVQRRTKKKLKYIPILDASMKIIDYFQFSLESHIPIAKPFMIGNEMKYISECIITNWISSQGKFVSAFERKIARHTGVKYAVATSSGTTALHLALTALGIQGGDQVIVPTLTFIATANAVRYTGADPIFVDSEMKTWGIDPAQIENRITPKTKAIIAVHLYGRPCLMDQIVRMARKYKLYVVEDAAQAQGAVYKNSQVGSMGDVGCFSFFGNKIITTGEGGMLVTNHRHIYERAKILRDHGMSPEKKYWHPYVGFNYRLTNLQAALGCAQMERFDRILNEKSKIMRMYEHYLSADKRIILPQRNSSLKSVCWLYSIVLNPKHTTMLRDRLLEILKARQIECRPLFYPIHQMPPYRTQEVFPVAEKLSQNGLSLPSYVGIQESQVEAICHLIKDALDAEDGKKIPETGRIRADLQGVPKRISRRLVETVLAQSDSRG